MIYASVNRRLASEAAKKLIYPAAKRNKEPILGVLKRFIRPESDQTFLEISSGSGQHVAHFAPHFPEVMFYPSEYDDKLLESISCHTNHLKNVGDPVVIDASADYSTWNNGSFVNKKFDYIYSANMIHISPYKCTIGLFNNSGKLLKSKGILFTYGPYAFDGKITPESNVIFDRELRSHNSEWGLRDIKQLEELAGENQLKLMEIIDMPANNKTLIWEKVS